MAIKSVDLTPARLYFTTLEQVVGRGLRWLNYDFPDPECVDVYGVPFEVILVKKKLLS